MSYEEAVDFLCNQLPFFQKQGQKAYKANLDNTLAISSYFNDPHKSYPVIHIAGTNGKGSTAHFLASILQENGWKVGLYTSPHLKDFRERIKVNGALCDKHHVVEFLENSKGIVKELEPTFFELTTIMAFEYFKAKEVDVAVVECGLGGRLDCTNIVTPILSVITNVSIDHVGILGSDLKGIAREKAGIIKPTVPVVVGQNRTEVLDVIKDFSNERSAECFLTNKLEDRSLIDHSPLKGVYQEENLATVLNACELLKSWIKEGTILKGVQNVIKNTGLLGRWQVLSEDPLIIADTGHNEAAIALIAQQLLAYNKKLHIVWAMMADKEVESIIQLLPKEAMYYFSECNMPRTLKGVALKDLASKIGLQGEAYPSIHKALEKAKIRAKKEDLIFIGGSTFTVAEVIL